MTSRLDTYVNLGKRQLKIMQAKLASHDLPLYCIFAVTNNCNSRCAMCNFWKSKSKNELTLEEIKQLFSSKLFKNIISIGITGGEPLLRPDIDEIVQVIYDVTKAKPFISTNGLMPARLKSLLDSKAKIIRGVGLSIDGLEATHNKVRGIPDAFKRVSESLQIIKDHGLDATVNMTIFNKNCKDLYGLWELYKNDNFTYKIAQASSSYYGDNINLDLGITEDVKTQVMEQMDKISKQRSEQSAYWKMPKGYLYNLFLKNWIKFGKRPLPCNAGKHDMYIDATGNIYPCFHKTALGNIRTEKIEDIWHSKKADDLRKIYKNCQECYERCTVSTFEVNALRWQIYRLLNILKKS